MGSWYESCGFSNLPVDEKPVRFMLIRATKRAEKNDAVFYPFDIFQPVSLLVPGVYADYGGVEMEPPVLEEFMASLKATGIELTPETPENMHGTVRINDVDYHAPTGVYHWFMREDVFQFLPSIITRDGEEGDTIGKWEAEQIVNLKKVVIEEAKQRAVLGATTASGTMRRLSAYNLRDAFMRLEMSTPAVFKYLFEKIGDAYPEVVTQETFQEGDTFDTINARISDPDVSGMLAVAQPMMDFQRLLIAMLTLRKMVHPMGGAGSQAWNYPAYDSYGKFLSERAEAERRSWDE